MANNKTPRSNEPLSRLCSFTVTFAVVRKRGSAPGKLSTKELKFGILFGDGIDTKEVERCEMNFRASFP
jgi:hypothetical protein